MHAYAHIYFKAMNDGGSEGEARWLGSSQSPFRPPISPDLHAVLSFSTCVDLASGTERGVLRHVVR